MKQTTPESSFIIITQIIELWNSEIKRILQKHALTQAEFTMLASAYHLTKENKNISQVNLCNYTLIKQMNASILLRKLHENKFLLRKEHPIDTRAKTVQLTPLGLQTSIKVIEELDVLNSQFFKITKNNELNFIHKLLEIRNSNKD